MLVLVNSFISILCRVFTAASIEKKRVQALISIFCRLSVNELFETSTVNPVLVAHSDSRKVDLQVLVFNTQNFNQRIRTEDWLRVLVEVVVELMFSIQMPRDQPVLAIRAFSELRFTDFVQNSELFEFILKTFLRNSELFGKMG